MSRYVTVITAREVYRYRMAYHADKFLHTIPNFFKLTLQSVVEERGCYYFKGLIRQYTKDTKVL